MPLALVPLLLLAGNFQASSECPSGSGQPRWPLDCIEAAGIGDARYPPRYVHVPQFSESDSVQAVHAVAVSAVHF